MREPKQRHGWLGERASGRAPELSQLIVLIAAAEGVPKVVFRNVAAQDNAGDA
jgi:hypothetical protein